MKAITPSELYELFGQYFSAGAIDLLMTLYEDDCVIVTAPGETARGREAVREFLKGLMDMSEEFRIGQPAIVELGGLALALAKWTMSGKSPTGEPVTMEGQTSDVLRRHEDGSWLFVIDNPFGANYVA